MNVTSEKRKALIAFEDYLDQVYGLKDTPGRVEFERKSRIFEIAETIKQGRRLAGMTQQDLAKKTGTKKALISQIENGSPAIPLDTLYKLIETGLGRKLSILID